MPCVLIQLDGGRAIMCKRGSMDEYYRREAEQQALEYDERRRDIEEYWRAAEEEAQRRGCDADEVVAVWEDRATYIPDYDDHDSDDPQAEQNILSENGMSVFNPFISRRW